MSTFKHHHTAGRDQFPDSLGAKTSAESISVALATDTSLAVTSDPGDQNYGAVGADTTRVAAMLGLGSTAVSNSNPVPVSDAGGSLTVDGTVAATQSGTWNVTNVSGTVSLPTGAATAANQTTEIGLLTTIDADTGNVAGATGAILSAIPTRAVLIGGNAGGSGLIPVEVSASGVVSVSMTGVALDATLSALSAKFPATLGQTTLANSLSVAIASNQGSLSVTATNIPTTVDTNSGAAGASTLRSVLATRHESVTTPLAAALSNGSNAIDYGSGAAGASTIRNVLATRHESASTPISVRISNGSAFTTPDVKGRAYADSVRKDYSAGSVTTATWVQLIASTAADINALMLFDSSGQTLELGTGAAASETRVLIIPPGGLDGAVPLFIASGTRLSVRAVSATASTGELNITGLT